MPCRRYQTEPVYRLFSRYNFAISTFFSSARLLQKIFKWREQIIEYLKSKKYDFQFVRENMMGPNCLKILEELVEKINLKSDMRVLDLGCGTGLTSIFLANEFEVQIFATDLWISATDNYNRFKKMRLEIFEQSQNIDISSIKEMVSFEEP